MDDSALVWGSSAKHKPQRVGKVSFLFIRFAFLEFISVYMLDLLMNKLS